MWLAAAMLALLPAVSPASPPAKTVDAGGKPRPWTVYLAQDKHLDYNWCGSTTEIELRMVRLMDYYLDLVQRTDGKVEPRRDDLGGGLQAAPGRGGAARRLLEAVQKGKIGCPGNRAVLLWGILSTELAIRACCGTIPSSKPRAGARGPHW